MSNIYTDGTCLANNPGWHEEDAPFKAKYIRKIIEQNKIDFATIAEVGCGTGEVLNVLSKQYPSKKMEGFDISPDAIALAKKKSPPHQVQSNLQFHNDDLLNENYDSHYDILLLIDVFEHVPDYLGFLQSCRHKATYKIFHIPLDINMIDVLRSKRLSHKRAKAGHLHYFTKETALDTLRYCDYEVVDCFYTPWAFERQTSFPAKLRNIPIRFIYALNKDWAPRLFEGFSLMVLAK